MAPLCRPDLCPFATPGGLRMSDIIVIVLGTGGILLMAAYAALCERI
jgi:hypothetical protein